MEGRIEITEAEILAALEGAVIEQAEGEAGYTTPELQKLTGWGARRVQETVRALILAGSWEAVKVRRFNVLKGHPLTVPGYRPKAA